MPLKGESATEVGGQASTRGRPSASRRRWARNQPVAITSTGHPLVTDYQSRSLTTAQNLEFYAAILGAAGIGRVICNGLGLAKAFGLQAIFGDAVADQITHHGCGAVAAELHVHGGNAAAVGVAVDAHLD